MNTYGNQNTVEYHLIVHGNHVFCVLFNTDKSMFSLVLTVVKGI